MKAVVDLLISYKHEIVVGVRWLFAFWVFSCVAGAIAMPAPDAPHWKKVMFGFLNLFAGNITRGFVGARDSILAAIRIFRGASNAQAAAGGKD